MREFKVGDKVNIVRMDNHYTEFQNPGTVDEVHDGGEYLDVMDSSGRMFTGGMVGRYELLASQDHYIVEGDETLYTLYSMAEEAARSLASNYGDPVAIAKVIAYAKPTTSIIVERV